MDYLIIFLSYLTCLKIHKFLKSVAIRPQYLVFGCIIFTRFGSLCLMVYKFWFTSTLDLTLLVFMMSTQNLIII